MSKIFIMSGLPFSGKTTLSKSLASFLDIPRVSFDETWLEIEKEKGLIPGSNNVEQWKYICQVCEEKTRSFLKQNMSVVYDNLGSTREQRGHIRQLAKESEAESKVIYVDISKEEVIKRKERNLALKERAQVSDENFDNALKQFETPDESEDYLAYRPTEEIAIWLEREFGKQSKIERE